MEQMKIKENTRKLYLMSVVRQVEVCGDSKDW